MSKIHQERPKILRSLGQELALNICVCMAQFFAQGGITMGMCTLSIVLDSFAERSGNEVVPSQRLWFMSSFALTLGSFILISGRLGDLFGLKKIFLIGWVWTTIWTLICGFSVFSNSVIFFIISRAFQGIGFALLLPCGLGILGTIYEIGPRKNFVFGVFGAMGPSGATLSGLMASVISQLGWWPWSYWVLGILCGFLTVLSYISIPDVRIEQLETDSLVPKWKQFDYLGLILGVSGLVLMNFVWNQGPVANWSAYIIVLLALSVVALVAFFYVELKVVEYPLLRRTVFNRRIGIVLLCIGLGWGSFGIWMYYYWEIMQSYKHFSAIMSSVCFLPFLVLGITAAMLCLHIISKTRPSYIILFSMLAFMSGTIMLSVAPIHQSYFRLIFGQMLILAWGMDLSFPSATIILSDCLEKHSQGMAGSLVSTVVNYSVSLAVGIAGVVEIEVKRKTGDDLYAIRCGLHFATGLAALGVIFGVVFVIIQKRSDDRGTVVVQTVIESDKDLKLAL